MQTKALFPLQLKLDAATTCAALSTNYYFSFEHLVKHLREFAENATMTTKLLSIHSDSDITIGIFFASLPF